MTDLVQDTLAYYDRNAAEFAAQTANVDLSPIYEKFLHHVRPGGRILDAGCGVGRDALALAKRGYQVVAFDASREMVQRARARVGDYVAVHLLRFEDLAWQEEFDAIWACASLLHIPQTAFPGVAARLAKALRPGGIWYMSFKLGDGERVRGDRLFVDHTDTTLRTALAGIPVAVLETWTTGDARPGRGDERWINALAGRLSVTDGRQTTT